MAKFKSSLAQFGIPIVAYCEPHPPRCALKSKGLGQNFYMGSEKLLTLELKSK